MSATARDHHDAGTARGRWSRSPLRGRSRSIAEISGRGTALHHDALIEGKLPYALALVLFLIAWQAMIAAMMVPSSLPLVRLFASAAAGQPRADGLRSPRSSAATRSSGPRSVPLAFVGDTIIHATVDRTPWLQHHQWLHRGRHARAGRRLPVQHAERPLPRGMSATPARSCCATTNADFPERFALGRRHGLFCLGCCWALMLLMFAAGVANLWWMAGLTALMVYEKTAAGGARSR